MVQPAWELWYRHPKPQSVNYTPSIVSYLDVLGFEELINTKEAGEISKILRILAESIMPHPSEEPTKIVFTRFSDTVIRSVQTASISYLIYELKSILRAQVALIPLGVAIRGAVTIGNMVQSWKVVYGPAVVRAYQLESIEGTPPRIVIDGDALNLLNPGLGDTLVSNLGLAKREGNQLYLDYLKACEVELNVQEGAYLRFLQIHRDFIRERLVKYAENPKVLPKYQWLRAYHESTLQEKFGLDIPPNLSV
jgi:hypothetical protein